MNVSLSPVNYNKNYSFKSTNASKKEASYKPTQKELADAKIKRTISECFCVTVGVAALYMYGIVQGKKLFNKLQAGAREKFAKQSKEILEPMLPTVDIIEKCRPKRFQTKL